MEYHHVQHSPIHFMMYVVSTFMFFLAWQIRTAAAPSILVLVIGVVLVFLALSFRTLTVSDEGDYLKIRYGPLDLFGTHISYDDMTSVEPGTTSIIDGWGIHFIPFRGWTFNLWGFECAKLTVRGKVIRIGTDDAEQLVAFLRDRISSN